MSGSPLLLDMLARHLQEERLADAHRERLADHAERLREPPTFPLFSAARRALAFAGQRFAERRSAMSAR